MAWKALDELTPAARRRWLRRAMAGVTPSQRDAHTRQRLVWTGWPRMGRVPPPPRQ